LVKTKTTALEYAIKKTPRSQERMEPNGKYYLLIYDEDSSLGKNINTTNMNIKTLLHHNTEVGVEVNIQ
jgi:hypothetical protein